mmetsp:Transcript_55203/g.131572  ORF Transcript_55203/g.131572 Transcript_55203/m.131572 type:complete len:201 (+) Transcript_55203:40-642(+)
MRMGGRELSPWLLGMLQFGAVVLSAKFSFALPGAAAPVSLQSFAVLASSAYVGDRVTALVLSSHLSASVALLALHWRTILTPRSWNTVGYIAGFLPAGVILARYSDMSRGSGADSNTMSSRRWGLSKACCSALGWNFGLALAGHVLILSAGASWLAIRGVRSVLQVGVWPFVPGMLVKSALCAIVASAPKACPAGAEESS